MNLFVCKLPPNINNASLKKLFEPYGTVSYAKVIMDRSTGVSKGFGFVEMPNEEEAKTSIRSLDKRLIEGSYIKVAQARPQ